MPRSWARSTRNASENRASVNTAPRATTNQYRNVSSPSAVRDRGFAWAVEVAGGSRTKSTRDRKSTRLNSSHGYISYAVFCLKKKKKNKIVKASKTQIEMN